MEYFLEEFSYFADLVQITSAKKKLPVNEINLVGGRFSGKSLCAFVFSALACLNGAKLGLTLLRASVNGSKDLFKDFCGALEMFKIPFRAVKTDMEVHIGSNVVKIIGVDSKSASVAQKAGLPRYVDVDYIITIFEEVFEFQQKQHQAIRESIRHAGKEPYGYMVINICNPWAIGNWFIDYCVKHQPFDEKILKEKGSQLGFYHVKDEETGFEYNTIFHYTNWRISQKHLPSHKIMEIKKYWTYDINRARVADYGLPGIETGAIYAGSMYKIGQSYYHGGEQFILAGMDYGWSQQQRGGKTTCIFGSATLDEGINIYREFMWDNALSPIDPETLAHHIVDFYEDCLVEFVRNTNAFAYPDVCVLVDNMNIAVTHILNRVAESRGLTWLSFGLCKKYPIQDRISVVLALMGNGMFRMNEGYTSQLWKELEYAHYEEKGDYKRAKENDHMLNALEYAIEPIMYQIALNIGIDTKTFKKIIGG